MRHLKIIFFALAATFSLGANAQDKTINATELPKEATAFLATHFKGNSVQHANIDTDVMKKTYEVKLTDGTEVEFTDKGNWKEVDGKNRAIPTAFILSDITAYVSKNYSTEKITKISKDSRDIEVELTNGVELEFTTSGKFRRIDN